MDTLVYELQVLLSVELCFYNLVTLVGPD